MWEKLVTLKNALVVREIRVRPEDGSQSSIITTNFRLDLIHRPAWATLKAWAADTAFLKTQPG